MESHIMIMNGMVKMWELSELVNIDQTPKYFSWNFTRKFVWKNKPMLKAKFSVNGN